MSFKKVTYIFLGLLLFGTLGCKKAVDSTTHDLKRIETWKTVEDYPDEITMDNWEEFLYAPAEVIAHFEELERLEQTGKAIGKSLNSASQNSLLPLGPSGLIEFYKGFDTDKGLYPFPGVTVTHCGFQVLSSNSGTPSNYAFQNNCNLDPTICMTVEPPFLPTQTEDLSVPTAGVTTLDFVLIQKHMLGIQVFEDPSQEIAADINRDAIIDVADLLLLKRLLLKKDLDWTISENYSFVDKTNYDNFVGLSQLYAINNGISSCQVTSSVNRVGIKTGDVNGSLFNYF